MSSPSHRPKVPALALAACAVAASVSVTAFAVTRSDSVQVSATVGAVLRVDGPQAALRANICRGRSSPGTVVSPVRVATNQTGVYALFVTRARFTSTDVTADISVQRPALAAQILDIPRDSFRTVPVSPTTLRIGRRLSGITTQTGDAWQTRLRFGTSTARTGTVLRGTVTYRATAGTLTAERRVDVVLTVRASCDDRRGED